MKLLDLIKEQNDWDDYVKKAASGPQKCGLTKGQGGDDNSKELKAWDKEVARQNKLDAKQTELTNKNFMSLSYDADSFPLDKQTRKNYYAQYEQAMQTNPALFVDGDGYNSQQKYAIASKVLDIVKHRPQISYSIRLNKKFGLGPASNIENVVNVINQMGGWGSFMGWFNAGGPEIK